MRLSIRAQIAFAYLAVILLLAAIEVYFLVGHYRSTRREAAARALEEARAIASAAAAFMVNVQDSALLLAQEAGIADGDPRRIQPILERMVRATRTPAYLVFILPGGEAGAFFPREILSSGLSFAGHPSLQTLRAGGEWEPIQLTQSWLGGMPMWGVLAAVRRDSDFLGAVAVAVPAREFGRRIHVEMPPSSWSIVDGLGRLVYMNGVAETPWADRDRSARMLIRRALSGEEATSEDFPGPDGVRRLGASVPIRPFNWAVEVSRPVGEVMAEAKTQRWIEGGKYGLVLVIAVLIAAIIGLVRLADPKTRNLLLAAQRNLPAEYLDAAREIPWGGKLAGYVAYSGEPLLVGRLEEQPEVSHLGLLAPHIQSLACLPLKAHDRVVGTLTLGHREPGFFGPGDLRVLLPAASMLAGAILAEQLRVATSKEAEEKALLFQELDHRVRNNLAALISLLHLAAEGADAASAQRFSEMADRVTRLAVDGALGAPGAEERDAVRLDQYRRRELIRHLIVEGPDRLATHVYRRLSADRMVSGGTTPPDALTWAEIAEWGALEGLLNEEQAALIRRASAAQPRGPANDQA